MQRTTLVIPCHNEAERLNRDEFERFVRTIGSVRLLFVDDGSSDGTLPLLRSLSAAHPVAVEVLHLPQNLGKAEAVRRGMLQALTDEIDAVGFWDADLATPLPPALAFLDILRRRPEIEAVVGARVRLLGHAIERRPVRRLLGRAFAMAASAALQTSMHDTQCGAKLFRATDLLRASLAEPFLARWVFDVELFARLIRLRQIAGLSPWRSTVYEFPLEEWRDVPGSRLKAGDFLKAGGQLAKIYWRYLRPGARWVGPAPSSPSERDRTEPLRRAA